MPPYHVLDKDKETVKWQDRVLSPAYLLGNYDFKNHFKVKRDESRAECIVQTTGCSVSRMVSEG